MRHPRMLHRPRGFFMMDLVIAMAMAIALLMSLTIAINKLHQAQSQLADTRTRLRHLEAAALALQSNAAPDPTVHVQRLADAREGKAWVRLTLTDAPAKASLVALVPSNAVGAGVPARFGSGADTTAMATPGAASLPPELSTARTNLSGGPTP